jgi:DNA-binding beta-propeller fold protein YncE
VPLAAVLIVLALVAVTGFVVGDRVPRPARRPRISHCWIAVWRSGTTAVANRGDGTISRLLASTGNRVGRPIRVGGEPGALAVTSQGLLVLDTASGAILELDPRTLRADRNASVPGFPSAVAVAAGAAWVVDARNGTVTRLSAK